MLRSIFFFCFIFIINSTSLLAQDRQPQVRQIGEDIQLIQLTENTYIHRSYKVFDGFGRVASNGLVYVVDSMCIIFDTPVTLKTTTYLLNYLEEDRGLSIKAVVANHFHEDCIAGLDSVHARGIPSYGSKQTIKLALLDNVTAPQHKFVNRKTFKISMKMCV
jgi:metallo-beta-lactamase class B